MRVTFITSVVWRMTTMLKLHHDGYKGGIFTPYTLTFREAYRTKTDYIK